MVLLFLPMDSFINQKEIAAGWEAKGGREEKRGGLCSRVGEDCLQKVSAASLQAGSQFRPICPLGTETPWSRRRHGRDPEPRNHMSVVPCARRECQIHQCSLGASAGAGM